MVPWQQKRQPNPDPHTAHWDEYDAFTRWLTERLESDVSEWSAMLLCTLQQSPLSFLPLFEAFCVTSGRSTVQRAKRGIQYRQPTRVGPVVVTVTPGRGNRCTVIVSDSSLDVEDNQQQN